MLCNKLPQINSLESHIYYLEVFMGHKSWHDKLGPLLRVSQGYKQRVNQTEFSSEGSSGEQSASKLIQVINRTHFLVAVCFSGGGHPPILEASCNYFPHGHHQDDC